MLPAFFVLAAMKFGGLSFRLALLVGLRSRCWCSAAVQAAGGRPDPAPRRAAARHLDARARHPDEGGREGVLRRRRAAFPAAWADDQPQIVGAVVSAQSLVIIAVACRRRPAAVLSSRTRTGRQMQATAQNPLLARVLGIPVERMILYTFLINAALVALASFL
jgi:branched-chain amino acid transport system permease protein